MPLDPTPNWLFSLPERATPTTHALKSIDKQFRRHEAPQDLCEQCFDPDWARRISKAGHAAQRGRKPDLDDFSGIYFEHPNCVGGEETLKLFTPLALRRFLSGRAPQDQDYDLDFLEAMLKAAYWFWPEPLKASLQRFAATVFLHWFQLGSYQIDDVTVWTQTAAKPTEAKSIEIDPDDCDGVSDDILMFAGFALLDPAELVHTLSKMHTELADGLLSCPGRLTPPAPFYCSPDTSSGAERYQLACEQIAETLQIRAARAVLKWITPGWFEKAVIRNRPHKTKLADRLLEAQLDYDAYVKNTKSWAQGEIMLNWPDLAHI